MLVTRQGPFPGASPRPQKLSRSRRAACGEESSVLSDLFVKGLEWGGRLTAGAEGDMGPAALRTWLVIMQSTEVKKGERGAWGRGGLWSHGRDGNIEILTLSLILMLWRGKLLTLGSRDTANPSCSLSLCIHITIPLSAQFISAFKQPPRPAQRCSLLSFRDGNSFGLAWVPSSKSLPCLHHLLTNTLFRATEIGGKMWPPRGQKERLWLLLLWGP